MPVASAPTHARSKVFWANDVSASASASAGTTVGFCCDYEDVVLHALSRDNHDAEQRASFYLQVDLQHLCDAHGLPLSLDTEREEDVAEDPAAPLFAEIYFWAEGEDAHGSQAEAVFLAMSDCAALHPSLDSASEPEDEREDPDQDEPVPLSSHLPALDGNGEPVRPTTATAKKTKIDFGESER